MWRRGQNWLPIPSIKEGRKESGKVWKTNLETAKNAVSRA
jgi:hypothetical protein